MIRIAILAIALALTGCMSSGTPYRPDPSQMVGPYDLTLSSHREAVFGKPHRR